MSSEDAYPADPKELPECRNSWGTAGGGTFFAVGAGFGGLDIPPTANDKTKNERERSDRPIGGRRHRRRSVVGGMTRGTCSKERGRAGVQGCVAGRGTGGS